jgi:hypothetical protein
MEEGRWAMRLVSEIGSARAAIAASYLRLWRTAGALPEQPRDEAAPAADQQGAPSEPPATGPDQTEVP